MRCLRPPVTGWQSVPPRSRRPWRQGGRCSCVVLRSRFFAHVTGSLTSSLAGLASCGLPTAGRATGPDLAIGPPTGRRRGDGGMSAGQVLGHIPNLFANLQHPCRRVRSLGPPLSAAGHSCRGDAAIHGRRHRLFIIRLFSIRLYQNRPRRLHPASTGRSLTRFPAANASITGSEWSTHLSLRRGRRFP